MTQSPLLTNALTSPINVSKVITPVRHPSNIATSTIKKTSPNSKINSNMIILNQARPSPITVKKITVPQATKTHAPIMTTTAASATPTTATTSRKESLYIVAYDQPSAIDSSKIVQYPSNHHGHQMVTLVTNKDKESSTTTTATLQQQTPESPQPAPKDKDRRNVAEILASLSGLLPEPEVAEKPNETSTTTVTATTTTTTSSTITPKAAILSGSQSGGGRIVRVLQSGGSRSGTPTILTSASTLSSSSTTTTTSSTTSTTTSTNPPNTYRSRKQVFVTNNSEKSDNKDEAIVPPVAEDSSINLNLDEDTLSSPSPKTAPNFDQDVLEEDFDDNDYKPYPKKTRSRSKAASNNK